jgi:hypothetical protein
MPEAAVRGSRRISQPHPGGQADGGTPVTGLMDPGSVP